MLGNACGRTVPVSCDCRDDDDDCYYIPVQVAVCCSQEQLHTREFIRNVEPDEIIDCDSPQSPDVLPPIGEFEH